MTLESSLADAWDKFSDGAKNAVANGATTFLQDEFGGTQLKIGGRPVLTVQSNAPQDGAVLLVVSVAVLFFLLGS